MKNILIHTSKFIQALLTLNDEKQLIKDRKNDNQDGEGPRVCKRGQCNGGKAGSFQNCFLPPIGPSLAGFGRYFGVRKLVPGATFWAHSRPPGGPKTARKITKTSWEFPCALTPFALPPFANSWMGPGMGPTCAPGNQNFERRSIVRIRPMAARFVAKNRFANPPPG